MNETEIFARVVAENNADQRAKLIDQLCSDNSPLKVRIERLVEAHENPETYVETPGLVNEASDGIVHTTEFKPSEPREHAGSMIGPYKLLQQIGEGGMGIVFMAEQIHPVKRRVALKVIKPGMDSRQIIARFEAERQALAMMDHPNIARVLDAGTTDRGQPYFVMELVNGIPITEYCDREKMPPAARLRLFVSVCRAVQHAHQKGIIHRDLKPNNILVAEFDGEPVAKVIDFGVAKATGTQLTEKTLFTEFGQVIGTLEYMSPEQARRNQLDVDTRSDIYSLGIVLYSLLTGETPFGKERFRHAAWEETMKIIREEEPPRPSVKLGSSHSIDQVATQRGVEPRRLSSLVRGDLDWIVMKTLEKDRSRRYASANELAEDISRHLDSQPLIARPPLMLDRITKFARRNHRALKTVCGLAVILILAVTWQSYQVQQHKLDMGERTRLVNQAMKESELAIAKAEVSQIGNDVAWDAARAYCQRLTDLLAEGDVDPLAEVHASRVLHDYQTKLQRREIATQIEEVVINGATNPDLESWQSMEREMREFFRDHGFDLDNVPPSEIGKRIRDNASAVMWADLLELWIGTLGQMSGIGGPRVTLEEMQPWADAIYVADDDRIRTGVRKFLYGGPPHTRDRLDALVKDTELKSLSARTLSWLASCYLIAGAQEENDRILETALNQYPHDLMTAHFVAYNFEHQGRWQEAARMYHRCLVIRNDVPGIWKGLANVYRQLGEDEAAEKATSEAALLENATSEAALLENATSPVTMDSK